MIRPSITKRTPRSRSIDGAWRCASAERYARAVTWLTVVVVSLVALAVILRRREVANFQALVLGGSIRPGCAIAQGIVLLAIAVTIAVLHLRGF